MSSLSALNTLLGSSSSSNGIDISQLLEAATGASSAGIDVTSAVSAAITAARAPEKNWQTQETALQSQDTALTQMQTDANNLDTDVQALNNITGPFAGVTVTSSDSSVLTASAAPGTATGNHTIVVNNLASTASWSSNTVASASTDLAAGSLTVTGPTGTVTTVSTGTGTSTLADVASTINGDNLGLTASVVTDDTGSRLSIVSNTSGGLGNFSVTPATGGALNFSQAVDGVDASIKVDGLTIQSATNTVTGVLSGVTLNLLNTAPGTNISVNIAPNTIQATSAINQFVADYNTLVGDLNTQYTDTGSGEGPLAADPTVRNLQSDLQTALNYIYTPTSGTTTVSSLSSLGISVGKDGTLSVNSTTLSDALQNNFSDVKTFFQGTALNGFANSLDQQLTNFVSPASGAFTVDLQSLNTQYTGLQADVTNFETNYITPLQTSLQSEYSQAEILLQQLPTETNQINAELGNTSSSKG